MCICKFRHLASLLWLAFSFLSLYWPCILRPCVCQYRKTEKPSQIYTSASNANLNSCEIALQSERHSADLWSGNLVLSFFKNCLQRAEKHGMAWVSFRGRFRQRINHVVVAFDQLTFHDALNSDRAASGSRRRIHHSTPKTERRWRYLVLAPAFQCFSTKDYGHRVPRHRRRSDASQLVQPDPPANDQATFSTFAPLARIVAQYQFLPYC